MAIAEKVKRINRLEHSAQDRQAKAAIPNGMDGFYASLEQNGSILNHLYPGQNSDNSR
jgi:hypothetical protein